MSHETRWTWFANSYGAAATDPVVAAQRARPEPDVPPWAAQTMRFATGNQPEFNGPTDDRPAGRHWQREGRRQ